MTSKFNRKLVNVSVRRRLSSGLRSKLSLPICNLCIWRLTSPTVPWTCSGSSLMTVARPSDSSSFRWARITDPTNTTINRCLLKYAAMIRPAQNVPLRCQYYWRCLILFLATQLPFRPKLVTILAVRKTSHRQNKLVPYRLWSHQKLPS